MIADILFIILLTFVLVVLLVPVGGYRTHHTYRTRFRRRRLPAEDEKENEVIGVGLTMLFFFFLLLPLIIAGNAWVGPAGPLFLGISWLPALAIGLLLALLLAAILPREPRIRTTEDPVDEVEKGAAALFGIMFFFLLILAFSVIIVGYV